MDFARGFDEGTPVGARGLGQVFILKFFFPSFLSSLTPGRTERCSRNGDAGTVIHAFV